MAVQTHPPRATCRSRLQSAAEARAQAVRAAHGTVMDYFEPTGAHITVRYEGTAPQGGHDYRVERNGDLQGLITRYPDSVWQAASVDGRTFTGFRTPLEAAQALLAQAGIR